MTGWYRCPQCGKIVTEGEEAWGQIDEYRIAFCSEVCLEKYREIGRYG